MAEKPRYSYDTLSHPIIRLVCDKKCGILVGMGRALIPLEIRYERHIRRTDSCWVWTKHVNNNGYAQMRVGRTGNGPIWLVHRWAYQHFVGPIPEGKLVLHHCDNKRCSRPDHLYLGTHKDNARDAVVRGRRATSYAFGPRHRKITDDHVRAIRQDDRPTHEIAAAFQISEPHVFAIKSKLRKGHVPDDGPVAMPEPAPIRRGFDANGKRILVPGKIRG